MYYPSRFLPCGFCTYNTCEGSALTKGEREGGRRRKYTRPTRRLRRWWSSPARRLHADEKTRTTRSRREEERERESKIRLLETERTCTRARSLLVPHHDVCRRRPPHTNARAFSLSLSLLFLRRNTWRDSEARPTEHCTRYLSVFLALRST